MGWCFNLLYGLGLLLASPWLVFRSLKTGRYRNGWGEKLFGAIPRPRDQRPTIWLHAVSVGEVQLLKTVVAGLEDRFPGYGLGISTTTLGGMELAKKSFPQHVVFYLPLDFTWAIRNALRRWKPKMLVLVELEVWPNLIAIARQEGCAVAIVNGRLSERSYRGYRRLRWLLGPTFQKLDLVLCQDTTYAQRFANMGVPSTKLVVTGNLKFDGAQSDRQHPEMILRREQLKLTEGDWVWVAGSTQSPEEALVLQAFRRLKKEAPASRLILVPRHPDRFEEVARMLVHEPYRVLRRSETLTHPAPDWDILLGDTLGELRWWWGLADVGFVGGSFGNRGGQNMIEPAALGVATAVGPNTQNFRDTVEILIAAGGLVQLAEPSQLEEWVLRTLRDPDYRTELGRRAAEAAAKHRGALARSLEAIATLLRQ